MKTVALSILAILASGLAFGQAAPATQEPAKKPDVKAAPATTIKVDSRAISRAEDQGVEVRIKDIAHFRGIRANQLTGFGLIVGLEGTGDTKKSPMTQTLLANLFKDFGTVVAPATIDAKNVALVMITAELPPFAKPGTTIDVRVSSVGDAKSLQGGTLLQAPLYAAGDHEKAFAVAEGAVSIGGFNASSGGSSVQKNHVNVGRIPDGAIVEAMAPTKLVFSGSMYLDLDQQDITTATRVAGRINRINESFLATANDGGTIQIRVPDGMSAIEAMSMIETQKVFADVEAKVVINERTGTIVIGGNVRLGPAAVAHGNLSIKIDSEPIVSQPNAFSNGQTVVTNETTVKADQDQAKVAVITPNTTVADLARILQALQLKPTDIIAILQALRSQGALKAKIEIQ